MIRRAATTEEVALATAAVAASIEKAKFVLKFTHKINDDETVEIQRTVQLNAKSRAFIWIFFLLGFFLVYVSFLLFFDLFFILGFIILNLLLGGVFIMAGLTCPVGVRGFFVRCYRTVAHWAFFVIWIATRHTPIWDLFVKKLEMENVISIEVETN